MKSSSKFFRLAALSVVFALALSCSSDDGISPNPNPEPNPGPIDPGGNPPPGGGETGAVPCENGMAGVYPCSGFDLVSRIDLADLGGNRGNDIWGWADPDTGIEYAIVGLNTGTVFISLEDPEDPLILGTLPTATSNSTWRDIKVHSNHAYIVSEAGGHGMQVFDLTQLRNPATVPADFSATSVFRGFGNAHNIVINEDTGFAYAVGTGPDAPFSGGATFIDLSDPGNPAPAGGYGDSGYTHDAQVVTYNGPDSDYTGREIFIGSNEDRVVIVDVTDKEQPQFISQLTYPQIGYTHQGWFTEDQRYFLLGDETDELNFGLASRTIIFDFTDLDAPVFDFDYSGPTTAIDHNGYVLGNSFYLANYAAGLRVLDLSDIENGNMVETGFFDSYPQSQATSFVGVWSVYPYLPSGVILINDINNGFFVVRPSS